MSVFMPLLRACAVASTSLVVLASTPGSASAVVSSGRTQQIVGGTSNQVFGIQSWTASTRKVELNSVINHSLASGDCTDSWFDWSPTGGGHYDARAVRNCKAYSSYPPGILTEDFAMNGMQKAGVAYGPNNNTVDYYLVNEPTADASVSPTDDNFSTYGNDTVRWWRQNSNGTKNHDDGGNPKSSTN